MKNYLNWMVSVFSLSFLVALPIHCFADSTPCAEGSWVSEPSLQDGIFDGTMTSTCILSGGENIGIAALQQNFIDTVKQSNHLLSGPISENYEGLDSSMFEVENESDSLDITSEDHVASDGRTRAIFSSISKQISSSSYTAGFTKGLDITIDVKRKDDSSNYELTMTIHIQVKKPGYIPAPGFLSAAKSIAMGQFKKQSSKHVAELQKLL